MKALLRLRGFTLIELLITVALAAIMLALAAPALQGMLANQRVSAAASELMTTAMQTRSAALKYNQRVIAQPVEGATGAWADEWRIFVDANENSAFDSGTDTLVLTHEALPSGVSIVKVTGVNNYFGYEGSGFASRIGGVPNSRWKISAAGTNRVRCMVVESSGRARIDDPRPLTTCPTS